MKKILLEIQEGKFAQEWMDENKNGRGKFDKYRSDSVNHPIEDVGEKLRNMMSWMR